MTDNLKAKALLTAGEHRDLGDGWSVDFHAEVVAHIIVDDPEGPIPAISITLRCRENGSPEDVVLTKVNEGIVFPKNLPATCREPLLRMINQAEEAVDRYLDRYWWTKFAPDWPPPRETWVDIKDQ